MSLVRRALVWTFRRVVGIYFREIEAVGHLPSPSTGGRLFVSNHVNALVDPILVLTSAPCPISPVAKSTLWRVPGLAWLLDAVEAVPIVRRRDDPTKGAGLNEGVFERVAAWLARGNNILIFPEGTSHNEPHLLDFKTGAARMLERAYAQGAKDATCQAVALEFDARDVFRSRCLLLYGPVRAAREFALEGEPLVMAVTERLRQDLSELLVEGDSWPERLLVARVAEMLANEAGERTLEGWSTIGRQVEQAHRMLGSATDPTMADPGVQIIAQAVDCYYHLLEQEGLIDEQIARGGAIEGTTAGRIALLTLALPLAILGTALYILPYQLPRFAAMRIANDPDEVSTYKLATGLVLFPIWATVLIALVWRFLPLAPAAAASAAVLASPFAALAFRDLSRPLRRSMRVASRARRLTELRAARAEAMALVAAARERLGL